MTPSSEGSNRPRHDFGDAGKIPRDTRVHLAGQAKALPQKAWLRKALNKLYIWRPLPAGGVMRLLRA